MKIGAIDIVPVMDGTGLEPLHQVVTREDGGAWNCPEHPVDDQGRLAATATGSWFLHESQ